jgi:hypothetical protein
LALTKQFSAKVVFGQVQEHCGQHGHNHLESELQRDPRPECVAFLGSIFGENKLQVFASQQRVLATLSEFIDGQEKVVRAVVEENEEA